jgi:AcrR family transcriptional regulator
LDAATALVAERGFSATSVHRVVALAGVSTRTFYEQFDSLEDCVASTLLIALDHVSALASRAFDEADDWQQGMCGALVAVLTFFDCQPALARICLVESLAAGPSLLERRQATLESFRRLVVRRIEAHVPYRWPLAAEGVLAAVLGLGHAHLVSADPEPLVALTGPLMGAILAPFLDEEVVLGQVRRGEEAARAAVAKDDDHWAAAARAAAERVHLGSGVVSGLPAHLAGWRPSRGRACLVFIAEHPGASNRDVADALGISHPPQVSRLLSRLCAERLLDKRSQGAGKRNEWRLTEHGAEALAAFLDAA